MSADSWVGNWRPHRPRAPIAALYGAPGPSTGSPTNVGFHLHDPSRVRAPAYSFGVRTGGQQEERSPGPQYLPPPGTTARGQDGTPAFSIHGRPRDLPPTRTPGCYSPERAGRLAFPSAPAFLRSRTRQGSAPQTPGPAAYQLPPMLGPGVVGRSSAPFSILGRPSLGAFSQDLCKTPGPCGYGAVDTRDVYKPRAPRYSIPARRAPPAGGGPQPGPGAYSPQEQGRRRGVTFGIRHSQYLVPLIGDVHD
ncbi:LOW QUALITY PROTEIN: ciliary microtubule associated protein 1B [Rhynochetos jubatus]